jgi:cytochrome c553
MWGMASQLDESLIHQLVAYYAAQTPQRVAAKDAMAFAVGKGIYEEGIARDKVPACQSCHGAAAEGSADNPRLAGQHPEYIAKQLSFYKSQLRVNAVMRAVCINMTAQQMRAVSIYAASK